MKWRTLVPGISAGTNQREWVEEVTSALRDLSVRSGDGVGTERRGGRSEEARPGGPEADDRLETIRAIRSERRRILQRGQSVVQGIEENLWAKHERWQKDREETRSRYDEHLFEIRGGVTPRVQELKEGEEKETRIEEARAETREDFQEEERETRARRVAIALSALDPTWRHLGQDTAERRTSRQPRQEEIRSQKIRSEARRSEARRSEARRSEARRGEERGNEKVSGENGPGEEAPTSESIHGEADPLLPKEWGGRRLEAVRRVLNGEIVLDAREDDPADNQPGVEESLHGSGRSLKRARIETIGVAAMAGAIWGDVVILSDQKEVVEKRLPTLWRSHEVWEAVAGRIRVIGSDDLVYEAAEERLMREPETVAGSDQTGDEIYRGLHYEQNKSLLIAHRAEEVFGEGGSEIAVLGGPVPDVDEHAFRIARDAVEKMVSDQRRVVRRYVDAAKSYKEKLDALRDAAKGNADESVQALLRQYAKECGFALLRAQRGGPDVDEVQSVLEDGGDKMAEQAWKLIRGGERERFADESLYYSIDPESGGIRLLEKGVHRIAEAIDTDSEKFHLFDVEAEIEDIETSYKDRIQDVIESKKNMIRSAKRGDLRQYEEKIEYLRRELSRERQAVRVEHQNRAEIQHAVRQLIRAFTQYERGTDYRVDGNRIEPIRLSDEHVVGTRFRSGLEQGIMAKEKVRIGEEIQSYEIETLGGAVLEGERFRNVGGIGREPAGERGAVALSPKTYADRMREGIENEAHRTGNARKDDEPKATDRDSETNRSEKIDEGQRTLRRLTRRNGARRLAGIVREHRDWFDRRWVRFQSEPLMWVQVWKGIREEIRDCIAEAEAEKEPLETVTRRRLGIGVGKAGFMTSGDTGEEPSTESSTGSRLTGDRGVLWRGRESANEKEVFERVVNWFVRKQKRLLRRYTGRKYKGLDQLTVVFQDGRHEVHVGIGGERWKAHGVRVIYEEIARAIWIREIDRAWYEAMEEIDYIRGGKRKVALSPEISPQVENKIEMAFRRRTEGVQRRVIGKILQVVPIKVYAGEPDPPGPGKKGQRSGKMPSRVRVGYREEMRLILPLREEGEGWIGERVATPVESGEEGLRERAAGALADAKEKSQSAIRRVLSVVRGIGPDFGEDAETEGGEEAQRGKGGKESASETGDEVDLGGTFTFDDDRGADRLQQEWNDEAFPPESVEHESVEHESVEHERVQGFSEGEAQTDASRRETEEDEEMRPDENEREDGRGATDEAT